MVSNYFAGASGAVVINADVVVVVVIVMVCVGSGGRMAGVLAVARLIGLTLAGAGRRTSGRDRAAVAVHDLALAAAATGSGSSVATVTHDVRRVRRRWMVMVGSGPGGSPGDREP